MAYETTEVSVEKSQGDVRRLLTKYGAQRFQFGEGLSQLDRRQWISVEFVYAKDFDRPHLVRIAAPLREPDAEVIERKLNRSSRTELQLRADALEQEARRIWRVIFNALKARMVSVEDELETFEQAFLPFLVDPNSGATVWEILRGPIEGGLLVIGGPGLPALPAGRGK